jgi:tetratricopeptide (TPR) repeat protein
VQRLKTSQCLSILIVAVLSPVFARAQNLDGFLRDSRTHRGIPYAKVELLQLGVRVGLDYSKSDGAFSFMKLEPGHYTISASADGYNPLTISVDQGDQKRVDLELSPLPAPPQLRGTVSVEQFMMPDAARKEFDRAQKDIQRQDCVNAIAHLESGLRLYAKDSTALNRLGNCQRKLGDFQGAETAFKQAMALSDEAFIVMNLAETYTARQRFDDAEKVLLEGLRKTPGSGDIYYALAAAYFQQGRVEDATAAALQADSRTHRIPDLHLLLAKIYFKTDPEKVAPQLELYVKEAPNSPESKRVREALKEARKKPR